MNKIALFGTSADPPTAGHQTILSWLAGYYDRVVVWASDNPFKAHQTDLFHRSAMLELAIAEIAPPKDNIKLHQEVSDRYTLVTVNRAREIWGNNVEFSLVIGSDILQQITSWYRIEELLAEVKLLIVPRPGYFITKDNLDAVENIGGKYAIASLNAPKVSSSSYRLHKDRSLVIPAVNNYIWQKNLYNVKEIDREKACLFCTEYEN